MEKTENNNSSDKSANPLRKAFRYLFRGRLVLQPLWEQLNWLSFYGLNIGGGSLLEESGELWVIDFFSRHLSQKGKGIVFDVGAHFGEFASEMIARAKNIEIYSFEPGRKTFELLSKNMGHYNNSKLFNFGFGDKEEEVTLYADCETSGSASVYNNCFEHLGVSAKPIETIHLKTLDSFCNEKGIKHIDFLKLDVEGHEYKVLLGGKNLLDYYSIDFIQFEFGPCNIISKTFLRDFYLLLKDKYKIYRILRDGLSHMKFYHSRHEAFITTNYLAISTKLNITP